MLYQTDYPQNIAENLIDGIPNTITCRNRYSAMTSDHLHEDQVPWVYGQLDGVDLVGDYTRNEVGMGDMSSVTLVSGTR